jgi:biopolymer transport protein ExbD
MRIRHSTAHEDKIELQMTPMIDIVFQLLVFFIMTFKIVTPEGDFNIKMPLASSESIPQEEPIESQTLVVRLLSGANGGLAGINLGQRTLPTSFDALRSEVINVVGTDAGPDQAADGYEVELDFDFDLRYEYVIAAIDAVTGYIDPDTGTAIKLIEKVKFANPRPPK